VTTCRELADSLDDYLADDLPPERRRALAEHLGVCPPCVALMESYQLTIRLARQLPPASLPPGLLSRLQGALAARLQQGDGAV